MMKILPRIAVVAFFAGCATTAGMNKDLAAKWVGNPVDSFFVANGPPVNQYRTQDGQTIYT